MSDYLAQTQAMLAKHHREGEKFAETMKSGFERRFGEAFWAFWQQWIAPAYSASPQVLDLGAGPGMFVRAVAERTPGLRAYGLEVAPYMLAAQVPLPEGCRLIACDLHDPQLDLAPGSIDAALASVVLHEMKQPVRALQGLQRLLKPGGRLLLLDWVRAPLEVYIRAQTEEARVFDPSTEVHELDDLFIHFIEHNRFSREDLIYLLNQCGFAVIYSKVEREGRYATLVAERRA